MSMERYTAPNKIISVTKARQASASEIVPHWGPSEILRLCVGVMSRARTVFIAERNQLLVLTLYDGALRVSEGLQITAGGITETAGGFRFSVVGKGSKYREIALSNALVLRLRSHAYKYNIPPAMPLFKISRAQAFRIIQGGTVEADLTVPEGVGNVHVLRHSGAIERLRQTGNPQSVQDQLGHSSVAMTMRYLRTLTADAAISIQESADLTSDVFNSLHQS